MNEHKIEELKNALREIMKMIISRGSPLTEELKLMLAQVMEHVASRIQQLRQEGEEVQEPGGTPTVIPPLEPGPYPSSNINSFKYDPQSKKLLVKFHGKDTADSGPIYGYDGVPEFIFDVFRRGSVAPRTSGKNKYHQWIKGVTPSLGASMYALIKNGGYAYSRLT